MVYLISYRLQRPGQDYNDLYEAIRKLSGTYWHHTTSAWLVETSSLSAKQIYEKLTPYTDANDDLVVFRLQSEWWGRITAPSDLKWLKERTF